MSKFESEHTAPESDVVGSVPSGQFHLGKFLRKKYGIPLWDDLPKGKELLRVLWSEVKSNWKSGVTVALVNVPLSISLAVASDADPVMGIVTAIWAVLFGTPLAGSNYNIVGPTGALSGLLSMYSIRYGESILPLLAIISGIMCLAVFILRLDRFFVLIPAAVTHGFTVGVAFIIALNQLPYALGLSGLPRHEEFYMNMYEVATHLGQTSPASVIFFIIFFVTLFTLIRKMPRIPWVIIICIVGIIIGAMMENGAFFVVVGTLDSRYKDLTLNIAKIPTFQSSFFTIETLFASASVTLIAVLETLISAKIADRMTDTKFDRPREVLGVGLANIGSGLFGGLPATAALARTALNVKSGATSRMSSLINAVMVILISVAFLSLFKFILLPVVAAVLVITAYRMVDFHELKVMYQRDKMMAGVTALTAFIAVVVDPTSAIVVGAMIALLLFAMQSATGYGDVSVQRGHEVFFSKSIYEIDTLHAKLDIHEAAVPSMSEFGLATPLLVYRMTGSIVYLNAEAHTDRVIKVLQDYEYIIMSLDSLYFIDVDGMEMLGDINRQCKKTDKRMIIAGVSNVVLEDLANIDWFQEMQSQGLVFASTAEALERYADPEIGAAPVQPFYDSSSANPLQYAEMSDSGEANVSVTEEDEDR